MKCKQCGGEFEAKRVTAQFCSPKCKLAYHRGGVSVSSDTVKKVSVSDKNVKIEIVPADEWRREYLEDNAEFFKKQLEETKDCKLCQGNRKQFKSSFMFCSKHLKIA